MRGYLRPVLVALLALVPLSACSSGPPPLPVLATAGWSGVEPGSLSFGGANDVTITSIIWQAWGQYQARGVGTTWFNDCQPSCATAQIQPLAVVLVLSQPVGGRFTVLSVTTNSYPPTVTTATYNRVGWPTGTMQQQVGSAP